MAKETMDKSTLFGMRMSETTTATSLCALVPKSEGNEGTELETSASNMGLD